MAQHPTYNIPDQSGTSFRTDLNEYLKAVLSNSAGATEPSNPLVGQLWYDTTNHLVKVRNSTNTAWTNVCSSVTAEVNTVATSSDTAAVQGYLPDVNKTANTLILRDGSANANVDIIGDNPTGDADTIGGYTYAQLRDMDNVDNRDYLTCTAGYSYIIGGDDFGGVGSWQWKVPFTGTYRLCLWNRFNGSGSGMQFQIPSIFTTFVAYNTQTTATKVISSFAPASVTPAFTGDFRRMFILDVPLTIGALVDIIGVPSGTAGSCEWAIATAEYGWEINMASTDNQADVYGSIDSSFLGDLL
jgi:hypothetical protein